MAKQNPLSYVTPNTQGAATVLPSPGFNAQQFFSEWSQERVAAQNLAAKEMDAVKAKNSGWVERISKYNKDYWVHDKERIDEKARESLSKIEEIAYNAANEKRTVNYSELMQGNEIMADLHQMIAQSKKNENMVKGVENTIRSANIGDRVVFDPSGLEQMYQDIRNGELDITKMNQEYLIPYQKFKDEDVISEIAKLLGTKASPEGGSNVTKVNPESIEAITEAMKRPSSILNRHLNNSGLEGEERQKEFNKYIDDAIKSIDIGKRKVASFTNISNAMPRAGEEDAWVWETQPIENTYEKNGTKRSRKTVAIGQFSIQDYVDRSVMTGQVGMTPQSIGIVPIAIRDMSYKIKRADGKIESFEVKAGEAIGPDQLEALATISRVDPDYYKKHAYSGANPNWGFQAYLIGKEGGNKKFVKFTKTVNSNLMAHSAEVNKSNVWGEGEFDKIAKIVKKQDAKKDQWLENYK